MHTNAPVRTGIPRRQFIKAAGLFAGTAMFVGAGSAAYADEVATATDAPSEAIPYEVYDTDILVIGGGFGALHAAWEAYSEGMRTMIVEKAPFGFGGGFGMNWGQEVVYPAETPQDYRMTVFNAELANQKLVKNVYDMIGTENYDSWNSMLWWVRMGCPTFERQEDGTVHMKTTADGSFLEPEYGFARHQPDFMKATDIHIIDRTMITDLFVSDGVCVGAIGYCLDNGTYRVFRAKAVVSDTGPCCQMHGWMDVAARGNTPDNTGELDAAAYRHGCSLVNAEFFGLDLIGCMPTSYGCGRNSNIGADGDHVGLVCDKDGNYFMKDHHVYDTSRAVREVLVAGGGGEHGGVFYNTADPESNHNADMRYSYKRNIPLFRKEFGLDVEQPGFLYPLIIRTFEHGGAFVVDEHCAAQIPGLYGTRGWGNFYGYINQQEYIGTYAAFQACKYARELKAPQHIDWTAAEAELNRLENIRTRNVEDGIRPHVIRHNLQNTFHDNWEPVCTAESMQTALDELERIKTEDLPRLCCADKSTAFNKEWKDAVELYSIIDITEATLRAGLMREESRLTFFRLDFPEKDEENWHALLNCTMGADGNMEVTKVPQVFVEE